MIPGLSRDAAAPDRLSVRLRRVLLVDEALPIRRKMMEVLHRAGIGASEVLTVDSAEQALEVFVRDRPSLVFTEFVGQGADEGLGMILEMLDVDPQARIVLLTAEDPESPLVRQAIRAGVFAVVRKPIRHEKIRQVLSEIEADEGGIERFR